MRPVIYLALSAIALGLAYTLTLDSNIPAILVVGSGSLALYCVVRFILSLMGEGYYVHSASAIQGPYSKSLANDIATYKSAHKRVMKHHWRKPAGARK